MWNLRRITGLLAAMTITFLLVGASEARAQQQTEDVVYLKDGGVIHGTIIEQRPGDSILIRTRDGNVLRFQMDQIERMAKEAVNRPAQMHRKNAGAAFVLSLLITGGGQAYNDQWGKGAGMLGGQVLGIALIPTFGASCDQSDDCGMLLLDVVAIIGIKLWSLIDAPITSTSINRQIEQRGNGTTGQPEFHAGNRLRVSISPVPGPNGLGLGLSVKLKP